MIRLIFGIGLLVISCGLMLIALRLGYRSEGGELLLNLGTEIFGILITVAVVDWLLERRRLQDRARELAWSSLHAVERAVWVWQGGPRRLDTDELLGLITGIDPNDELQPYTRSLLVSVGAQSREALNREASSINSLPGLKTALEELTSLNVLSEERSSVSIPMVTEILETATRALAGVLSQSTQPIPAALVRYRDASLEAQAERYYHIRAAASDVEAPSAGTS